MKKYTARYLAWQETEFEADCDEDAYDTFLKLNIEHNDYPSIEDEEGEIVFEV